MAKQVILCDHAACNGHLTLIAESQPNSGMQYDDPVHASYFYQCSENPTHLYVANAGGNVLSVNPESIHIYRGNMTADYIKRVMVHHKGNFYPCDDDTAKYQELIEKLPPTIGATKVEYVERERRNDRWGSSAAVIRLPDTWAGKKVKIEVVE